MKSHFRKSPHLAACSALLLFAQSASAQTIEDGLDNPATNESFTNEGLLITDSVPLPSGLWQYDNVITHDGVDSIKATLPDRATSQLDTVVQGPAIVSFWWKIDGETSFDRLWFASDNTTVNISGVQDWAQRSFQVDCGDQALTWLFERLSGSSGVNKQAWLDQLVITPIPNNPALQTAVENSIYTIHSTDWTSYALAGALNGNVAKSGPVNFGETSTMVLEIEGPASVSFDWGIATDDGDNSQMTFEVVGDSNPVSISGTQSLTNQKFDLPPGTHCLKFTFERDFSGSENYMGPSEGYVDHLVINSFGPSPNLANAIDRLGAPAPYFVYSDAWSRSVLDHHDGSDSAQVTAPTTFTTRRLYAELPDEAGLLSFWTKLQADPAFGYLFARVDGEIILEINGVRDWTKTEINLGAGKNRLFEAIFIRYGDPLSGGLTSNSKAFLDELSFTPGATNFQPDLSVGPLKKPLKGSNRFNSSGSGQKSVIKAPVTRPLGEFNLRIRNQSSSDTDEIRLRGVGSRKNFDIYLVVTAGKQRLNYSAAFAAGVFSTLEMDPKAYEQHEVWVVRKRRASRVRSHRLKIVATSTGDPSKRDVVKTLVKVKRR